MNPCLLPEGTQHRSSSESLYSEDLCNRSDMLQASRWELPADATFYSFPYLEIKDVLETGRGINDTMSTSPFITKNDKYSYSLCFFLLVQQDCSPLHISRFYTVCLFKASRKQLDSPPFKLIALFLLISMQDHLNSCKWNPGIQESKVQIEFMLQHWTNYKIKPQFAQPSKWQRLRTFFLCSPPCDNAYTGGLNHFFLCRETHRMHIVVEF